MDIGGKARGLLWLTTHGYKVPRFVCVTSPGMLIDAALIPADLYAVRSSAPVEDGTEHSWAGMFETKLNVPVEGLRKAYEEVSRPPDRAWVYAERVGADLPARIPVVVMEMVDAVYSGVAVAQITPYPRAHVEGVMGLGDGLVGGEMSPERLPAELHERIHRNLVGMAEQYGGSIDVEWAIDHEDTLWFLQCRPLTVELPRGAWEDDR